MGSRSRLTRMAAFAAMVLTLSTVACSDSDPVNPDPHANVQSVLVEVVDGGTVTFNSGKVASGQLGLFDNAVVAVTFMDSEGETDAIAQNPDNFELRVNYPNGNPAGLAFTPSPTNPFAGTFTRTSPTSTPMVVQFELYHLTGKHDDGKWNVETIVE